MINMIRDQGFDDLTDTRILSFLQYSYNDVWSRESWPFKENTSSALTLNVGGKVTVPADIGKVIKLVDTSQGLALWHQRLDEFTEQNSTQLTLAGDPDRYFFIGNDLYVWPIPTSPN